MEEPEKEVFSSYSEMNESMIEIYEDQDSVSIEFDFCLEDSLMIAPLKD